jgi:hypothetical protein
MKAKNIVIVLLIAYILVSCAPTVKVVPTETYVPTLTLMPIPPTSTINPTPTLTFEDLTAIIMASYPASHLYDPESVAYAEFPEAVTQLSNKGTDNYSALADLALAINFPRQYSYLAAQALIPLGRDAKGTIIATLFSNLDSSYYPNQKPEALIYSTILLGSIGNLASCAVGNIGPLLWHSDSKVRSAAAFALERITNQNLVASQYEIEITPSFLANSIYADEPEGSITGKARQWWNEQGSKIKWHSGYGICDP